jgi:hypothetical protein
MKTFTHLGRQTVAIFSPYLADCSFNCTHLMPQIVVDLDLLNLRERNWKTFLSTSTAAQPFDVIIQLQQPRKRQMEAR